MEDSVRFVRLVTGEDLISVVTSVDTKDKDPYYILNNPMKVMYTMPSSRPGYYSVALSQWVSSRICEEQDFTLYPTEILTVAKPTEAMIEYYWSCVDHFNELLQEQKQSSTSEQTHDEGSSSSYDEPVDDSETLQLVEEVMNALKSNKNTFH